MMKFTTNVDGRGNILSEEQLSKGDLVFIQDKVFDVELYKIRLIEEQHVEMKPQKTVLLHPYEPNCNSAEYNVSGLSGVFCTNDRINRNQTILIDERAFIVSEIEKQKGQPTLLIVEELDVKKVKSFYPIYCREENGTETVFKECDTFYDAILTVSKLRTNHSEKRFYRLK